MTKTTFTAFGVVRSSDTAYTCASMDSGGTVRFHQTLAAARRFGHRIADVRVIDAAEAKVIKAADAAKRARLAEDSRKVTACALDGGDWRTLRDELALARHHEATA